MKASTLPQSQDTAGRNTEEIWLWNNVLLPATERCVHNLFSDLATIQPEAPAVCAWDGEMTFRELDERATRLAGQLVELGVGPEASVPLCFEKSMWMVVAMLAVLKAGGAFVPLDPDHPRSRHEEIFRQTKAQVVLASENFLELRSALWVSLGRTVVAVKAASTDQLTCQTGGALPTVHSRNATYVIFTSGSTGTPKGVVLEHRAVSTSCLAQGSALGFSSSTRALQFAAYASNICITEIFTTLLFGGCICIPSEDERRNSLVSAINTLGVNWASLTPSVARLLDPASVSSLKILKLGGEQVNSADWERWYGKVSVRIGYGLTECCVTCCVFSWGQKFRAGLIGKPIGSVGWVVDPDDHNRLASLGSVGELLIEGPILARGYLGAPEKTAAAFIDNPPWLAKGGAGYPGRSGRLYKTGDLVRYDSNGSLINIGRKDSQVKIRGQRVELGEIEYHIQECIPEAQHVVAEVVYPLGEKERAMLVAFVHIAGEPVEEQPTHGVIGHNMQAQVMVSVGVEERLAERLPAHMVPTVFFALKEYPMTTSGKTDRKTLRNIGASFSAQQLAELRTQSQGLRRQPSTETEKTLQQLWARVLGIQPAESIWLNDDFFQLGGDSIAAMKLVGEARKEGLRLTAANVFHTPQLGHLANHAVRPQNITMSTIPHVDRSGPIAQSFAQGRLWFLEELHPGLDWYLMPSAVRIRGLLQLDALKATLQAIEYRHETLRTTFSTSEGKSMQEVHPFRARELKIIDFHSYDNHDLLDALQRDQSTPFDLRNEPGWRVTIYRLDKNDYVLSIVMHHIISDGWSMHILRRELTALYSASIRGLDPIFRLPPLSIQYRDFSLWQTQQDQIEEHQRQLDYWVTELQMSRPAEFLSDKPRPVALSGKAGTHQLNISGQLYDGLWKFCKARGVTLFVVLLAAFRSAHYHFTGQDDATIGAPNANRDRWELNDIIGFFVNIQCLRIKIGDKTFEDLVQHVYTVVVASLANQDVPFESIVSKLQRDRDLSRHPLVQIVLAVHSQEGPRKLVLEGVETEAVQGSLTSRFDLELHFSQEEHSIQGHILFSKDLYCTKTITSLASVFQSILDRCLDEPKMKVASIPLLTHETYTQLEQMGLLDPKETVYPRESSIVDLFRQQAADHPSRTAVKDSSTELTYTQLDTLSDRLARCLSTRSFIAENLVGIIADRSCQTVVALLGILKAGLAYLPFDVKIPEARMKAVLSSIKGPMLVLLGDGIQPPNLDLDDVEFLSIVEALNRTGEQYITEDSTLAAWPSATSLAYVMFTSGSTSQPKGVMVEHRGIVRLVKDGNLTRLLPPSVVMAHIANLAFDASTWEIYVALLNGGTLVCIDYMTVLDYRSLGHVFVSEKVQIAMFTPALLKQCLLASPSTIGVLDTIYVGADRADPHDMVAARKLGATKVINAYGPTENCVISTLHIVNKDEEFPNGVPIGWAINNSGAYVMHEGQRLVPLGVIGELVVTGDGLARGYTDPERDIDRFVTVTVRDKTMRAYRTGDYVRYRPTDGQLEFFGRIDGQVKIRSHRVELGEIESVLRSHRSVHDAIVVSKRTGDNDLQLFGYITLEERLAISGLGSIFHRYQTENGKGRVKSQFPTDHAGRPQHNFSSKSFRQQYVKEVQHQLEEILRAQLPGYMIPQSVHVLDTFPVNQNGKVDRRELAHRIETKVTNQGPKWQPSTEIEKVLQKSWARVLDIDPHSIVPDDCFFRMGGDSIAVMKLVAEARKEGVQLTVANIFQHPKLVDQIGLSKIQTGITVENIVPFSLLGSDVDVAHVRAEVAASCSVDASLVEDIYPCSPLQEGLMSLTSKRAGDYIMQSVLELRADINEDAFQATWKQVVQSIPILRTRIVQHSTLGLLQTVVMENSEWVYVEGLEDYLKQDQLTSMDLGDPLTRYALVKSRQQGKAWFVWTIHHALYDGWSLPFILSAVRTLYNGTFPEKRPSLNVFIKYIGEMDQDAAVAYWQAILADCEATIFPSLPSTVQQPVADTTIKYQCPLLPKAASDITTSSLVRAAWAIIASRYTNSVDVVFGVTVTGRNAPVVGIETIVGPTIATVPVRVRLRQDWKVSEFLQTVQQQATEMIPFEQTGLQRIAKMGPNAQHVCGFQTLLVVQPADDRIQGDEVFGTWRTGPELQGFTAYALTVQCTLAPEGVQITASFDARVIERWQVERMLRQFSFIMQQLTRADSRTTVADIDTLTIEDKEELWRWNRETPPAVEQCVHDLFAEQVIVRPKALAICAWDGEISYSELDELSNRLAGQLANLGVQAEVIVPLCFEKSMWMVVAMLAVLKAGAAFVPLDPEYPSRHKEIFKQTKARIVLTSAQYAMLCRRDGRTVVTVHRASISKFSANSEQVQARAQPSSAAYVIFTSGSTGVPKGVALEHKAVSTSCLAHGNMFGVTPSTRALQFAAYTFDACIAEIITILVHGGCVCVPSESERRDHLADVINTMHIDYAILTPSVSRLLDPGATPSLKTLILAGELGRNEDWKKWTTCARLYNGYGPTECCICSNAYYSDGRFEPGVIGKGIASVSWVVDPNDHTRLAPLGCIGELLVEGPILARGYLNDAEKTAAVFINDPGWLVGGSSEYSGRQGRLYKTGDLVRYDADGNLVYVGRKDGQVKVRGQRVEPGEIEHQLHECMPTVTHVAVEVILSAGAGEQDKAMVAAFLQLDDEARNVLLPAGQPVEDDDSPAQVIFPVEADRKLVERVPSYMVPQVYFAVVRLPMTTSGKTDRRRLREIGASFSAQRLAARRMQWVRHQGSKRQPSTEAEKALQQLWAQVLNIDMVSIGMDDSFFQLGGDSITAMQISSSARSLQIPISTNDILQKKTIARLVRNASLPTISSKLVFEDPVNRLFGLTPIQELYLRLESSGRACFDQGFFLEVNSKVQCQLLCAAFATLVQRHSLLRARFSQGADGKWQQLISNRTDTSFTVNYVRSIDSEGVMQAIRRCRSCLDIQNGPVLAAILCGDKECQLIYIAVHHLVIDLVSWRVLLEELEDLLLLRELPAAPPVPFQVWQTLQAEHAAKYLCASEVIQDKFDSRKILSYWGVQSNAISYVNTTTSHFTLNEEATFALLRSSNDAYQTRPVELILAALIYSFSVSFPDRELPTIFNESHGRETWDESIDLSRTVGWFTSMFPVQVPSHTRSVLLDIIRHTKDNMRRFTDNGRSYFASCFANTDTADTFTSIFPVEIVFNYQGVYQQLERKNSLFKSLHVPDEYEPISMLETPRFALFDVSLVVENRCMRVAVVSDKRMKHQQQIANWIKQYEATLLDMTILLQQRRLEWTLSDLPLSFKTYRDLDEFQKDRLVRLGIQPEDIEDVFPCSPIQEGILFSQGKDPDAYRLSLFFEALSSQHGQVSCTRLQQAWKAVVRRHSLLRALLVDSVPGSSGTTIVVLKDPKPSISFFRAAGDTATLDLFRTSHSRLVHQDISLQHHMSFCQLDNGKVYLCLYISHAIFDAHSQGIILRDLRTAYSAELDLDGAPFKNVISYLAQRGEGEARTYWAKYLSGVKPCSFPIMAEAQEGGRRNETVHVPNINATAVHAFCQAWEVTLATVIQTAWALVLSRYTGSTTPCFGNLISRRNLPISDVGEIFGPLVAMLPCRVHLGKQQTILEVLRAVQDDHINSLPHQSFSLSSMLNMLGLGISTLFNTSMSLLRTTERETGAASGIVFNTLEGLDPTEYDIAIGASFNNTSLEIIMSVRTGRIDRFRATNLAGSLSRAISKITEEPMSRIQNLDLVPEEQKNQLWKWNRQVPPAVERCIHDLILQQARARPKAPAICAWDGKMAYGELDELSDGIAGHLVDIGVEPEDTVLLYFEKSAWTVVAMLAVLRAGAAFASLDPEHPASRHQETFRQTKARVVLASEQLSPLCESNHHTVVTVGTAAIHQLLDKGGKKKSIHRKAHPHNAAYISFTSGSTGVPKGVVIEHCAITTSCLGHGKACKATSKMRVLQFASYTFDTCIQEIITTLSYGGCVCVPSEGDRRNNLVDTMNAMEVTYAILTPSVARLVSQDSVRSLQTVVLVGEQVSLADWKRWSNIQAINGYGPAECSVCCTAYSNPQAFASGTIGKSIASASWVVDPDNYQRLAPLGSVGELLIEGPILARGYLDNAEMAAFIHDPVWLLGGCKQYPGRRGRLYKTGDLVRYNADGNLVYVGRKDGRVKVRGQRIETGEIEYHVRDCMPAARQVAAEVITPEGGRGKAVVAVFLQLEEDEVTIEDGSPARVFFPAEVDSQLREHLPSYMVPEVYFAVARLPIMTSGKIDRKTLRSIGASFSTQSQGPKRQPSTEKEKILRQLWARVLNINADNIGLDDSFFRLGGDSITAMKLVGEARKEGLQLTVADVIRNPRLDILAGHPAHDYLNNAPQANRSENKAQLALESRVSSSSAVIDWDMETAPPEPSAAPTLCNVPAPKDKPKVVVLTGCTGFLGRHLLNTLVTLQSVRKIICLAVRRLSERLVTRQLPPPSDRIIYYEGDLTQPQFGLLEYEWAAIFSEADAVIHNGADTSHIKYYSALRVVNVESTKQLVRSCLQRMVPIHYISSASTAIYAELDIATATSCTKTGLNPSSDAQGYLCSKWVCESMLERVHAKYGLRVVIQRPSAIIREGEDRVLERARFDVMNEFLHYVHKTRRVPQMETVGTFNLVSVETCCNDAIRELLRETLDDKRITYVNSVSDVVIPKAGIANIGLDKVGKAYEVLTTEEWRKTAVAAGMHPAVAALI